MGFGTIALPNPAIGRVPLPCIQLCGNGTPETNFDWGQRWQTITKWPTPDDGNDYPAHEQTYEGFIMLVKYGTTAVIIILALMAYFLL